MYIYLINSYSFQCNWKRLFYVLIIIFYPPVKHNLVTFISVSLLYNNNVLLMQNKTFLLKTLLYNVFILFNVHQSIFFHPQFTLYV